MSKNQAAFPSSGVVLDFSLGQTQQGAQEGMTLRDYFAAKAMQGSRSRSSQYLSWQDLAVDSYEIADAMLAAREVAQ